MRELLLLIGILRKYTRSEEKVPNTRHYPPAGGPNKFEIQSIKFRTNSKFKIPRY